MNKDELILFETDFWTVYLSPRQSYLGRCVIDIKRPCGSLSELTSKEWLDFEIIVKKLESLFKKAFDATMFNWTCLMNNAYKKDVFNPKVHWHLRPRYSHPVIIDKITFLDPNFAHHYDRTKREIFSDKILKLILEKLKKHL